MAGTGTAGAQATTESAAEPKTGTTTTTEKTTTENKPAEGKPATETTTTEKKTETATEAKPAGSTETSGKAGEAVAEPKAPEKYELKVPDDAKAYVDADDLKYLETIARASNWTNEDAQAALEEHLVTVQAQSARFLEATKADPNYGGEKLAETQRRARAVIDRIRPVGHERRDRFLAFMGRGGAGNHVEVLSFLADLGKAMGEDSPTQSRSAQAGGGEDTAAMLYDHPTSRALEGKT